MASDLFVLLCAWFTPCALGQGTVYSNVTCCHMTHIAMQPVEHCQVQNEMLTSLHVWQDTLWWASWRPDYRSHHPAVAWAETDV